MELLWSFNNINGVLAEFYAKINGVLNYTN